MNKAIDIGVGNFCYGPNKSLHAQWHSKGLQGPGLTVS